MRFLQAIFATVLLATLTFACALAQSGKQDVSGVWSGSFEKIVPDGRVEHDTAVLILKQDGSLVTGSAGESEDKQLPIQDGKSEGHEIQFHLEAGGTTMFFHLHLDGAHLKGEVNGGTPDGKIVARVDTLRGSAQAARKPSPSQELFQEISEMDSVLFDAYNRRDLEKFKTLFTEDLEFYHDLGGLTFYRQNMEDFQKNFESATKMRRELVEGTLEVYPIKGYGAVEIGVHRFYSTDPGQKERLTGTAKFVHVWQKKNGEWKIARVVSYDHH